MRYAGFVLAMAMAWQQPKFSFQNAEPFPWTTSTVKTDQPSNVVTITGPPQTNWSEWRCASCVEVDGAIARGTHQGVVCENYICTDGMVYPPKPHRWAWLKVDEDGLFSQAQICVEHGETRVRELLSTPHPKTK